MTRRIANARRASLVAGTLLSAAVIGSLSCASREPSRIDTSAVELLVEPDVSPDADPDGAVLVAARFLGCLVDGDADAALALVEPRWRERFRRELPPVLESDEIRAPRLDQVRISRHRRVGLVGRADFTSGGGRSKAFDLIRVDGRWWIAAF